MRRPRARVGIRRARFALVPEGDHLTAYIAFAEEIFDFLDSQ